MCGIGVLLAPTSGLEHTNADAQDAPSHALDSWPSVLENLKRRGPDCLTTIRHHFCTRTTHHTTPRPWMLSLTSSVLSLRGAGITTQPLSTPDGRLLLAWNGQIFDSHDASATSAHATSSRVRLDSGENDGLILLDRVQSLLDEQAEEGGDTSCAEALSAALAEIEGPYAFVLFDRVESRLYFGRDPLGRRSLLLHRSPQSSSVAITSVASEGLLGCAQNASLTELGCSSIWTINLLDNPTSIQPTPRHPSRLNSPLLLLELCQPERTHDATSDVSPAEVRAGFLDVLSESVRRRVTNIATDQPADEAHVAVLFSGGLDCTTLALLADRYVPAEQPIDLLNVGFENIRAIEAAKNQRQTRLRAKLKTANKKHGKLKRRKDLPRSDVETMVSEAQPAVAPVESPKSDADEEQGGILDDIYAVPDRITGLASLNELCRIAPKRRWNFVEINVPYTEYTSHRGEVETLMSPTASVMDLSIGSALYFASRAQGQIRHPTPESGVKSYTSPARVLISGLGADELLGGYSRHRQSYLHSSVAGLIAELQLDLTRLPERNLGRDDRILSCHGKESRYPYLDRSVLDYLTCIPVSSKVDLGRIATEGAGGDKRLLRDIAKQLGLHGASELKKRAMQFGTRSAKIDNESRNVKGHHKLN